MKKLVIALSDEILNMYPIRDLIEGWYFTIREFSTGAYEVKGIDKWGHSVSRQCSDSELDETLQLCASDARDIEKQLKNKNT